MKSRLVSSLSFRSLLHSLFFIYLLSPHSLHFYSLPTFPNSKCTCSLSLLILIVTTKANWYLDIVNKGWHWRRTDFARWLIGMKNHFPVRNTSDKVVNLLKLIRQVLEMWLQNNQSSIKRKFSNWKYVFNVKMSRKLRNQKLK